MKKTYVRALSVEELVALPDDQIDTSDIPELGADFWQNAKVVTSQVKPTISLRIPQVVQMQQLRRKSLLKHESIAEMRVEGRRTPPNLPLSGEGQEMVVSLNTSPDKGRQGGVS